MKKLLAITIAVATASSMAFAQQTVTSERTETKATMDGGAATKTTTKVSTTEYVDHMRTVYSSAGIEEAKTERLIQLDRQLIEAYRSGDVESVRRLRTEIRQILGEDVTRVHTYIESNPLPRTYPDFVVNTYAPEASFTRDIEIRASGASTSTNVGVDANVNRTGTATQSQGTQVDTGAAATTNAPGSTGATGTTGAGVTGSVETNN